MSYLKLKRIPFLIILAAAIALMAGVLRIKPVHAATPTTSFTVTPTANGAGVIILDQVNGKITFCTSLVNISGTTANPAGSCAQFATIAPTSGVAASLSAASASSSTYVINNVTGEILECAVLQNLTGSTSVPEGSCVSRGSAF